MAFNWTDENVQKLQTMWAKGMSARKIGEELGGISRNSVIGKAHRMGLSTQKEKEKETAPKKTAKATKATPVTKEKIVREPIHIAPQTSLSTDKLCQWPKGEPGTPDFGFCYGEAVVGRPYCEDHCNLAYRRNND